MRPATQGDRDAASQRGFPSTHQRPTGRAPMRHAPRRITQAIAQSWYPSDFSAASSSDQPSRTRTQVSRNTLASNSRSIC